MSGSGQNGVLGLGGVLGGVLRGGRGGVCAVGAVWTPGHRLMDAVHGAISNTTQRIQCWTCMCVFQANVAVADECAAKSSLRRGDQDQDGKIRPRFCQHILQIPRLRLAQCKPREPVAVGDG